MATTGAPNSPAGVSKTPDDITIYSHSPLFYWWPVWAVGFVIALLTYVDGGRMVIVPSGTQAFHGATVSVPSKGETIENREVVVLPQNARLNPEKNEPDNPELRMAHSKNYGVLWTITLLIIIFLSNVPLRGLWSIVIIVCIALVAVIFALPPISLWDKIFEFFSALRIHINAGGYLFISTVLFIIWASTFFFFDRRVYMVFSSGQIRVCTEIGEGEKVFDATGASFQKHQNDIFRHWIIGMGAGDLVVKTGGQNPEHFDFPNVLFVGHRVKQIEQRLRTRDVV